MISGSPTTASSASRLRSETITCRSPIIFFESKSRPTPNLISCAESTEKTVEAIFGSGIPTLCNCVKKVHRPETPSITSPNSYMTRSRMLFVRMILKPPRFAVKSPSLVKLGDF